MSDPVLEALWKKVVVNWDDDTTHGAFLEHCRTTGQLLEAAVRYRGMAGDHARGPSAEKRLRAIGALAMASLETERAPRNESSVDWARILLILLFLAGSLGLLSTLSR